MKAAVLLRPGAATDFQFEERSVPTLEAGRVQLRIGRVFTLAEIAAAHQLMEANAAGGKIVVTTSPAK